MNDLEELLLNMACDYKRNIDGESYFTLWYDRAGVIKGIGSGEPDSLLRSVCLRYDWLGPTSDIVNIVDGEIIDSFESDETEDLVLRRVLEKVEAYRHSLLE